MHRISQGSSKTFKCHLHHISIFHMHTGSETQAVRPKEMHVNVTRAAVGLKLEMMVFHILQAVAHLSLPGPELC